MSLDIFRVIAHILLSASFFWNLKYFVFKTKLAGSSLGSTRLSCVLANNFFRQCNLIYWQPVKQSFDVYLGNFGLINDNKFELALDMQGLILLNSSCNYVHLDD